jgi:hypothetical protein
MLLILNVLTEAENTEAKITSTVTMCSLVGGYQLSKECITFIFSAEVEAICSSETSVTTHKTAWPNNLEDHKQHLYCHENFNFR